MISKMTKYSFILLSGQTDDFLSKIQELGVMDITRSRKPVDENSARTLDWIAESRRTVEILERLDYSDDPNLADIHKAYNNAIVPEDAVSFVKEQTDALETLRGSITAAENELRLRAPWGNFDSSHLKKLALSGYELHYYSVPQKKFDESWEAQYPLQVISSDGKNVWFVVVSSKDEDFVFPIAEIPAPGGSIDEAQEYIDGLYYQMSGIKGRLLRAKDAIPALNEEYGRRMSELDLYLASAASQKAAEDMVTLLVGFAPSSEDGRLSEELDKMDVLYIAEAATEHDNPPIKLRNNRFVKMFEPLTGMYGMPVYSEFDPTPVLAPFFMLFFAMCMGDAGYGIILMLFGLAVHKKWINIGMFKGLGPLISTLGAATFAVGIILGTAFGVNLYEASWVPQGLKNIMLVGELGGYPTQMVLAVGIGVFHICLAMTIKAIGYTRRFGFKANISTWGWLLLIVGGIIIAALSFIGIMSSEITKWAVIAIGVISALGIYVFNTPGRNPLVNIGSGLWDTYNMATGLLGDVLSYIRLYALGLAGGMLGAAFNNLGNMVLGNGGFGWIPFVIIVILGHTINVAMSCLGAFVHPLRLTFVEYFKNSGYEGKGTKYNPLTLTKTE